MLTQGVELGLGSVYIPRKKQRQQELGAHRSLNLLCFCQRRSQPGSMAKEKKVNSSQGRALCHFRHRALAVHKSPKVGRELPGDQARKTEETSAL